MDSRAFLAASSLLAMISATPAFAQDAQQTPAPAPDAVAASEQAANEGEVIVVTAQLREQRLLDVPVAITAYSGEFLDRLGVNDFEELSRFTPGFSVQNQSPNNPSIVIRGITSDTGEAFAEPRISIFQDGVSVSRTRGAYVELFDLERVEVVRGPQSTLYGRGALIGAVNLIQNKADPSGFDGRVEAGLGNFDYGMLEGMVNVPLSDNAAVRVAGRYRKRDGFVQNLLGGEDFNSVDTGAIRGAVRIDASDRVRFDLIGNYQEDHPSGTSFKAGAFNPTDPVTGEVLGNTKFWTGAALAPGAGFEGGKPLGLDRKVWSLTGLARFKLNDDVILNSITGYRKFDALEIIDVDGVSLPIITGAEDARGKQFSQELRVTWDSDGPLDAFFGASYFRERGSQRTPAQFDERVALAQLTGTLSGGGLIPGRPATDPAPLALFGNTAFTGALLRGIVQQGVAAQVLIGTPNRDAIIAAQTDAILPVPLATAIAANLKSNHGETTTNFSRTQSFDIFADATWHVTDRLELGAGARYSHDDKRSTITAAVLNGRSILGGFIGALSQPAPVRDALLMALAAPGAATIPPSPGYPVPLFGLTFQPTNNNGDPESRKLKDGGFSWRLNARYDVAPNTSAYASYSRGRRPEVLAALPPVTPFGPSRFETVPSEVADSYEVGARHETRALLLDGALFYYKYKNFQTVEQEGTLFVTANAGKADNYGFEGQIRWRPITFIELFGNYAYNHARFKSGIRDGNRLRLSPDHKLALGAIFDAPVGPGRINFVPSITYQSKVFFDDDNDRPELQTLANGKLVPDLVQNEFQKGYALVNARLGYTFNERFKAEAFVNNLLDKHYLRDAGNTGDSIGLATFIAGEPRTYGVQFSAGF